jgi:hypothetical protein
MRVLSANSCLRAFPRQWQIVQRDAGCLPQSVGDSGRCLSLSRLAGVEKGVSRTMENMDVHAKRRGRKLKDGIWSVADAHALLLINIQSEYAENVRGAMALQAAGISPLCAGVASAERGSKA